MRLLVVLGRFVRPDSLQNLYRLDLDNRTVAQLLLQQAQEPLALADRRCRQPIPPALLNVSFGDRAEGVQCADPGSDFVAALLTSRIDAIFGAPPYMSGGVSVCKAVVVMPFQKGGVRVEADSGAQGGLLELPEILAGLAALAFAQVPRDVYATAAIDGDQSAIECAVERGGK